MTLDIQDNKFKKIGSDGQYDYFLTFLDDKPLKLAQSKSTGEILLDAGDVRRFLGYESLEEFLGSDTGLDVVNSFKDQYKGTVTNKPMG